jgi:uncharacterized lipoprotein
MSSPLETNTDRHLSSQGVYSCRARSHTRMCVQAPPGSPAMRRRAASLQSLPTVASGAVAADTAVPPPEPVLSAAANVRTKLDGERRTSSVPNISAATTAAASRTADESSAREGKDEDTHSICSTDSTASSPRRMRSPGREGGSGKLFTPPSWVFH